MLEPNNILININSMDGILVYINVCCVENIVKLTDNFIKI